MAKSLALALIAMLLLSACSQDPGSGPAEVRWDRDVCVRCNMVLSDRLHSAQIRHKPVGKPSMVHKFDDLGCAVLWLDKQPWGKGTEHEIWVTDHRDGKWLDAKTAFYVTGHLTPMEYGLGAQSIAGADTLNYEQAKAHIVKVEQTFNVHGAHLKQNAATPRPASPSGY